MRVAAVFDAFHEDNNRSDPYVYAQYCSVITAMPSSDKGVEVAKRSVIVTENGITVGAVNYPYTNSPKDLAFREVKAVKSANLTFRCVRQSDGRLVPVRYDKRAGMYVAESGETFRERDIMHKYFNSQTLEQEETRINNGQPLQTCPEYVDWMRNNKNNKRILDQGIPSGRDMASCVDEVYFGEYTPSRSISLPEFYLRTRQVVDFKPNAVEDFILKTARSKDGGFAFEFPSGKGVVTKVERDEDYVYLDFTRVQQVDSTDPDKPGKIWVTTDKIETMEFPNTCKAAEVLVDSWDNYDAPNVPVDSEHVLNTFVRLVRTIPHNPTYTNFDAVIDAIGGRAAKWISERVVEQHMPVIRGVPSIALSLLGTMPSGVTERDFFARNRRSTYFFECEPSALVQRLNDHVQIDLLHHYWYRSFKPNKVQSGSKLHVPAELEVGE